MKAYTDLNQSKKLAEILPLESADMRYGYIAPYELGNAKFDGGYDTVPYHKDFIEGCSLSPLIEFDDELPCWSLAALLDVLPNEIRTFYEITIRKYTEIDNQTLYQVAYGSARGSSGSWHDMINTGERQHLVDACYEMIIILHKQNLL